MTLRSITQRYGAYARAEDGVQTCYTYGSGPLGYSANFTNLVRSPPGHHPCFAFSHPSLMTVCERGLLLQRRASASAKFSSNKGQNSGKVLCLRLQHSPSRAELCDIACLTVSLLRPNTDLVEACRDAQPGTHVAKHRTRQVPDA